MHHELSEDIDKYLRRIFQLQKPANDDSVRIIRAKYDN